MNATEQRTYPTPSEWEQLAENYGRPELLGHMAFVRSQPEGFRSVADAYPTLAEWGELVQVDLSLPWWVEALRTEREEHRGRMIFGLLLFLFLAGLVISTGEE